MENIQQQIVSLDGGLILNKDPFTQPPGSALQLQNFEPSIKGGYRRINRTNKYVLLEFNDTNLGTSGKTGSGAILLSVILGYDIERFKNNKSYHNVQYGPLPLNGLLGSAGAGAPCGVR